MKKRLICSLTLVCLILSMFTVNASALVNMYCTRCSTVKPHDVKSNLKVDSYYHNNNRCYVIEYWLDLLYTCDSCGKTTSFLYKKMENHSKCGAGTIVY